ncbi:PHP domain-containing protein [Alistipes sp.]|uniref:PHP domain-containing protein n=1 Tax=Alistipes sp. TaxID=1872444 RepID=UPI003AF774DE
MIDFETINSGASFYKADLHIHSYGEEGSFDVTDTTMTPENIVDTAIEKGLSIISITDHNEDRNVKKHLNMLKGKTFLLFRAWKYQHYKDICFYILKNMTN